ncbi:uncharacterized protein BX664DRAFT_270956, partial [Halteromyces radiatus]|uniref:uncharacterized protein n=1 Tax=Halteromyces radiatus TaxID=101107 RepID=UPI00221ED441
KEMDLYLSPKYNAWIDNSISPLMTDFSKDRSIKFVCPSLMNTLRSKYYDDDGDDQHIRRSDQVICVPPTHNCLWTLQISDGPWINDIFKDTFATVIQPQSMAGMLPHISKKHQLWVKVLHVEQEDKSKRIDIYIIDKSNDTEPALLSFYGQQTHLSRMVQRGDYLGLYHPIISTQPSESQQTQTDIVFECGPDTILFIMSNEDAIQAGVTKKPANDHSPMRDFWQQDKSVTSQKKKKPIIERDDEGLMDCSSYTPRIMINDLESSMLNITICGRVIAKANNNPFFKDGKKMDRYAMRVEDESGKMDVTLWEKSGHYARKIQVGHRILLTGLSTSVKHNTKGKTSWYVNGSTVCGTEIYNLSRFDCLLRSKGIRQLIPLHTIQGDGQWETKATIVGWELHTLDQTIIYSNEHTNNELNKIEDDDDDFCINCLEIMENDNKCNYCGIDLQDNMKTMIFRPKRRKSLQDTTLPKDKRKIGWLEWRLDNGQGILYTYGGEESILNCKADQFQSLSNELQIQVLDSVVGKQWICSISFFFYTFLFSSFFYTSPITFLKMKFTVIATTTLAVASVAQAAITIVTPWADTTWNAGAHGAITWKTSGTDATQKCEIQLLNGNSSNANLVAYITDPKLPTDCSVGSFDIYPLNDFASGKYSIRIGQSASSTWAYSGVFNFVGNGSAKPLQLACK